MVFEIVRTSERVGMATSLATFSHSDVWKDLEPLKIWSPKLPMEARRRIIVYKKGTEAWTVCRASSRGFGPQKAKKPNSVPRLDGKQSSTKKLEKLSGPDSMEGNTESSLNDSYDSNAPNLMAGLNVEQNSRQETSNSFEGRLEAIKRSAQEKKKMEEGKAYGPIDYDSPISKPDTKEGVSFPVKVTLGIAVVVFGLIFAFGDLLPSGEIGARKTDVSNLKEMNKEELSRLKEQLDGFEAILKIYPDDLAALEGAAVTYAELGEYSNSEAGLQKLIERKPKDVDALRLLAEVESALGKFEQSAAAYRKALKVYPRESIALLQGLVDTLILEEKPNEAVEEIIAAKERLKTSEQDAADMKDKAGKVDKLDPVQIDLLLGKTYSDWGHRGDAIAVYDFIINNHPEDFRGYLAKAILLKEQGQKGEAERMFIQARYLAPEKLKSLVDQFSRR